MDISVIIPSYNRANTLERALLSVIEQNYKPFEIIVIDDGSTDHTEQLVKNSPYVKYIKQENQGVSAARNAGIKTAKGEWLAFLDSDDEWLPNKLMMQKEALQQQADYKLCHTNEIWIRNGQRVNQMKKHEKKGGYIFQDCLPLCVISPSSVMIHHSIFDELGLFDENLPACEDYDLWLRICAKYPVLYLSEALLKKHGGHEDQLSRKYWGMDRFRIKALEKIITFNDLKQDDKIAAMQILLEKIRIFLLGAKKRDQNETIEYYTNKQVHYTRLLETISK